MIGFPAYSEEHFAKAAMRWLKERGIEGGQTVLTSDDGQFVIYGVKIMWPDDHTEEMIKDFLNQMHEDIGIKRDTD